MRDVVQFRSLDADLVNNPLNKYYENILLLAQFRAICFCLNLSFKGSRENPELSPKFVMYAARLFSFSGSR